VFSVMCHMHMITPTMFPWDKKTLADKKVADKGIEYAKRMKSYNPLFRMVARIF
jgi:hypothetical protein